MTQTPTGQEAGAVTVGVFAQRFSSTPRGARLARHLAVHQLHTWGIPHGTPTSDGAALIVAELAANAVTHGRVPGRDFELRLTLMAAAPTVDGDTPRSDRATGTLRIEVSDTRTAQRPPDPGEVSAPAPLSDTGRGLFLVGSLAARWSVRDRTPSPGKTVAAELDLPW